MLTSHRPQLATLGVTCIRLKHLSSALLSRGKHLKSVDTNNRNPKSHPIASLEFLLSFLKNRRKHRQEILDSLTKEEISKLKILWLILSSYLEVLTNSEPPLMMLDELAERINKAHSQCQTFPTAGLLYARDAGDWLLEAKAQLPPEKWEDWFKASCHLSEHTAQTYMQMARGWPGCFKGRREVKQLESSLLNLPILEADSEKIGEVLEELEAQTSELATASEPESAALEASEERFDSVLTEEVIEVENSLSTSDVVEAVEIENPVVPSQTLEKAEIEPNPLTSEPLLTVEIEQPVLTTEAIEELIEVENSLSTFDVVEAVESENPVVPSETLAKAEIEPNTLASEPLLTVEIEQPVLTTEAVEEVIEVENSLSTSDVVEAVEIENSGFFSEVIEAVETEKPPLTPELTIEVLDPPPASTEVESYSHISPLILKEEIVTIKSVEIKEPGLSQSPIVGETPSKIIRFYITGSVVPKARPRVTSNGTFLPPRYREWRNLAEFEIHRQVADCNLPVKLPIKKAEILLKFLGKHRRNSDLDNLAGACLDALTLNGAGVLEDDRISCVSKLTVEYEPEADKTGVLIEIHPL
ncbi:MAG: RusA family crossover junction endodeoxyribonuclease [Actinomycetota bacterium]